MEWWKRDNRSRHPRINKDTRVYLGDGRYHPLAKNSFVSPVRKVFLPYDHWSIKHYDETTDIAADTPAGFGLIGLEDIDW